MSDSTNYKSMYDVDLDNKTLLRLDQLLRDRRHAINQIFQQPDESIMRTLKESVEYANKRIKQILEL